MAKLFIGLAIAVMLAAAALGFLAKGNIDKLQSNLKETRGILATTKTTLQKTEGELKDTQEKLTAANASIEKLTADLETANREKAETATKLAEATDTVEKLRTENEKLKLAANPNGNPPPAGDAGDAERAILLQQQLTKAQSELAEAKAAVDQLTAQRAEKEEALANANKEITRYRQGITRTGLSGSIVAVNPGWNFVVLSVGDRQGASPGANMLITRNGQPIGKARITSVEPSTSIADILPGSVQRGVSVQPGDSVVYEGPRTRPAAGLSTPAPNRGAASGPQ